MQVYPLVFKYKQWIQGQAVSAGVEFVGHILMTFEDGEWWATGVTPGGIAESGATIEEAYGNFKRFMTGVLIDRADRAGGFEAFRQDLVSFLGQTNRPDAERWTAAREQMRKGLEVDGFISTLPKLQNDADPRLIQCVNLVAPMSAHPVEPVASLPTPEDHIELAQAA